jgi:hypothetical protein
MMSLDPGLRHALVSRLWSLSVTEEHGNSELVVLHLISPALKFSILNTRVSIYL